MKLYIPRIGLSNVLAVSAWPCNSVCMAQDDGK